MASALHIKDSFVAILINLGNTSRRTTHFDEGSSVFPTLPLPRKGRSSIEAGSSRSLEKGSVVNSDPWEVRLEVFGGPLDVLSFGIFKGEFDEGWELGMVV